MDAFLRELASKESKVRAEALVSLQERLQKGFDVRSQLDELCARLAENIPENNIKACTTACTVTQLLAEKFGQAMRSHVDTLVLPLADVLGNAKPAAREKSCDALLALMTGVGADPVVSLLVQKCANHKSWRVREGFLTAYARQAEELGRSACVSMELLAPACAALADAQPDLRKAAADALARLGSQVGMAKVLAQAEAKGARPAQIKAVTDRYTEITGQPATSSSSGAAAVPAAPEPSAAASKKRQSAPPGLGSAAPAAPAPAPEQQKPASKPPRSASMNNVVGGAGGAVGSAGASARPPTPTGQGAPQGQGAAGGVAGGRPNTPQQSAVLQQQQAQLDAQQLSAQLAEPSPVALSIEQMGDNELAAHPAMSNLTHLHSGPWWEPGIPNQGDVFRDDIGRVRTVPLPRDSRELARAFEEFAATCSNTTNDWKARGQALDRLRGMLAAGVANVEGFPQLVGRLRDPLCAQVQDLRSSICKQACTAAAELAAIVGNTFWFEPLADSLVETLGKLTYVTIAVVAQSAHGCIQAILHNTKVGFPKVIPKLTAGARTRSPTLRARCSEYLLTVVRGWSPACLERHADDIQLALISLLTDADPTARQCARLTYWSFTSIFPARETPILNKLDANAQRLLSEDLDLARRDAMEVVRTPVMRVPCLANSPVGPLPTFAQAAPVGRSTSVKQLSATTGPSGAGAGAQSYASSQLPPMPSTAPAGDEGGRIAGAGQTRLPQASALSRTSGPGRVGMAKRPSIDAGSGQMAAGPTNGYGGEDTEDVPNGYGAYAQQQQVQAGSGYASGQRYSSSGATLSVSNVPAAAALPSANSSTGVESSGYGPASRAAGAGQGQASSGYGQHTRAASGPPSASSTPSRPSVGGPAADRPAVAVRPLGAMASPAQADVEAQAAAEQPQLTPQMVREVVASVVARYAAGDVDHKGVRDRSADLLNAAVRVKSIDARSIVRAYGSGDRVPPAVSVSGTAISGAHTSMASARSGSGPGHVSYPPLSSPTAQLDPNGIRAMLQALNEGRLQRGIKACLGSAHEFVVVDGLAMLSTLLDTHADAYSLVVLEFGQACLGPGVTLGSDSTLRMSGAPLPVVLTQMSNPALMLAPVYARMLLRGPDADSLDTPAPGSPIGPGATGASSTVGAVSDAFRALFSGVLQCTSGGTERVCSAGKRALACIRRAYPVSLLLAVTLSTLLTDSAPRVQMVALHLIRDMLNDPGGAEYFGSEMRTQRLLGRVADMLTQVNRGTAGSSSDPRAPSSPFYGINELTDALIATLLHCQKMATLSGLARLSPDQLRTLIMVADADVGGGGSTPGLQEAVFKAKQHAAASAMLQVHGGMTLAQAPATVPPAPVPYNPASSMAMPAPVVPAAQPLPGAATARSMEGAASRNSLLAPVRQQAQTTAVPYTPEPASGRMSMVADPRQAVPQAAAYTPDPAPGRVSMLPAELPRAAMVQPQPTFQSQPIAMAASALASLPPGFPHVIPLTRANLELVLDTLASPDKAKQLRALHYFGRAVDVATAGPSAAQAQASGRPLAPPAHPDSMSPMMAIPPQHASDHVWLSLLDRVIMAVLNCVPLPGTDAAGLPQSLMSPGGSAQPGTSTDALTMTQTSLSVIRKLFRNCTGYVAGKSGVVFSVMLSSLRHAPRDVANVLERSLEEVADRLPTELALTHLVTSLTEADAGDATQAVTAAACLRVLTRLVPHLPVGILTGELAKGRLMEGVRKAFLSMATDVRRCVVGLLVEVYNRLRDTPGAFGRYVDAYLTAPQAKLLQIYIDKAQDGQAAGTVAV